MADKSQIEWTDATWNPVRGCTKVSPGCKHCYAETFAERFRGVPDHPFEQGFDLKLIPHALELPLKWKSGRLVFVNSMSDLFHEDIPVSYIKKVFGVMKEAEQHRFQVLTKRSKRLLELAPRLDFAPNIWMGVSVESERYVERVRDLQKVPAKTRFLSVEPLLGPIGFLPLRGIHWVIVGGESGAGARPMKPEWVREVRDRCKKVGVPFFFKQWGGFQKKKNGRTLDGRTWDEMPGGVTMPQRLRVPLPQVSG